MWWWRKGLDLLVLLVHMVFLVGVEWFIVELSLSVWLGMVGVCNNSLVVDWVISGHLVFGGLGFGAVPSGMRGVFSVKKAIEPSRLWGSAFASTSRVGAAALLCGVLLATSGVSSLLLVGDSVHLLLVAVWPAGFGLCQSDPCPAGLGVSLGFCCDSILHW
jgi:hypothetical protein